MANCPVEDYCMAFVANPCRPLTRTPEEALEVMRVRYPKSGLTLGGPFCSGRSKYLACSFMGSRWGILPARPAATVSSKDSASDLAAAGVDLISPQFANTNVDLPALPAAAYRLGPPPQSPPRWSARWGGR